MKSSSRGFSLRLLTKFFRWNQKQIHTVSWNIESQMNHSACSVVDDDWTRQIVRIIMCVHFQLISFHRNSHWDNASMFSLSSFLISIWRQLLHLFFLLSSLVSSFFFISLSSELVFSFSYASSSSSSPFFFFFFTLSRLFLFDEQKQ